MLRKDPQTGGVASAFKKGFKVLLIGELALAGGCFIVYQKLNTDRDFRHWMSKKYPTVLDGYYQLGEKLGSLRTREEDRLVWESSKK